MLLGPPAEPILPCPSDTDFDIFPDPAFVTEGCLMRGKAWRLPVGRSQFAWGGCWARRLSNIEASVSHMPED
jgi:hypothetical protein